MAKKPKMEVVVEESEKQEKSEKHEEKQESEKPEEKKEKTSWKKLGIGLGVVLIGNLYSFLTAYSKGILFDNNTIIGLLAIVIGLYIILK